MILKMNELKDHLKLKQLIQANLELIREKKGEPDFAKSMLFISRYFFNLFGPITNHLFLSYF